MDDTPVIAPPPLKPHASLKKGIFYVLISWIFFTSLVALSKEATARTSIPTVLFFQNFISMLLILPWVIRKGGKSLYLSKIGLISLRSLAGFLNYAFIFLAVQRIPLVNVVLLSNTAPLFIPLIIWMWKRVKIRRGLWMGILIGFIGIAFIIKPTKMTANVGVLLGLAAGICMSVSMIAQRRLVKSEPTHTILFYYFLISSLLSFPFILDGWKGIDMETLFILVCIGLLFISGQLFFVNSLKHGKPSILSSFNYSSVIYGALIEWIIWNQFPDWLTVMGILIVCLGGIITIRYSGGKGIGPPDKDRTLH